MRHIFALVDCNNFYVSCERVFAPHLDGKPVVVMSNNDGCVVSRSDEVKQMGIGMGQPIFEAQDIIRKHDVQLLSSNYTLYGDMSRRVMQTLGRFTPDLEIYSIDEAFLELAGSGSSGPTDGRTTELTDLGRRIQATVLQWTGVPVSVGVGRTKTLAKLANRVAKQSPRTGGVLDLTDSPHLGRALQCTPVGQVWGIGPRFAGKLRASGYENAWQLSHADDGWIRQQRGISGLRTVQELRGLCCYSLEDSPPPRQSIAHTRTFSRRITSHDELREAVAAYATRASEKLRQRKLAAGVVTVFVMTNLFTDKLRRYFDFRTFELTTPSNDTGDIIHLATQGLDQIYKEGFDYKKAGVLLDSLVPEDQVQTSLFGDNTRGHSRELMQAVDKLNQRFAAGTVGWAAAGLERSWQVKFRKRSPRYTTCWREIPVVTAHRSAGKSGQKA